jgi:hypothetical protein
MLHQILPLTTGKKFAKICFMSYETIQEMMYKLLKNNATSETIWVEVNTHFPNSRMTKRFKTNLRTYIAKYNSMCKFLKLPPTKTTLI